ncbi:MAG: hypothetical protein U5R06_02300 [candidate division KSB1 bacterium]|nr:hypothetical protein [candidate division KSB1 bacterium]
MLELLFVFLFIAIIFMIAATYYIRKCSHIFHDFANVNLNTALDVWLDNQVTRTVFLVKSGKLDGYYQQPCNHQEEKQITDKILQDVLTNAGLDPKDYHLDAIIQSKFHEINSRNRLNA